MERLVATQLKDKADGDVHILDYEVLDDVSNFLRKIE